MGILMSSTSSRGLRVRYTGNLDLQLSTDISSHTGETIIGGSYQKGDWNTEVDMDLAQRIIRRALVLCPELTNGQGLEALEIVRHVVGLRLAREGGIRVERELIDGVWVVHNYGHGGYGCEYWRLQRR